MATTQYNRETLEVLLGEPRLEAEDGSERLAWPCGCVAQRRGTNRYLLDPCQTHRADLDAS